MDRVCVNGGKLHQPTGYTTYVCATCGYFENYMSASGLAEIAKAWPKVPVKGIPSTCKWGYNLRAASLPRLRPG